MPAGVIRRSRRTGALAWLLTVVGAPTAAVPTLNAQTAGLAVAVDAIAREALAAGPIAGLSVAIVRRGEVVHAGGYGWADHERRTPAEARTVYVVASVSKLLTSMAALHLVAEGRLGLDDDLASLLPEYPDTDQARRITLRHLLTHTSGIPDGLAVYAARWDATHEPLAPDFVLEFLRDRPLDFEPGASWSYSNTAFYLVGMILERTTGTPLGEYLRAFFRDTADLEDTFLCDDGLHAERRTIGYDATERGLIPSDEYESAGTRTGYGAAGGMCSTALDLALLPDRMAPAFASPAGALAPMLDPTLLLDGAVVDYGLGARLGMVDGHPLWGHTGGSASTWAMVMRYPEDETTIAVLVNTNRARRDAADVHAALARTLFGSTSDADPPSAAVARDPGAFAGGYESIRDRRRFAIAANGDALTLVEEGASGTRTHLRPIATDTFTFSDVPGDRVRFHLVDGRAVGYSVYYSGVFIGYRRRLAP